MLNGIDMAGRAPCVIRAGPLTARIRLSAGPSADRPSVGRPCALRDLLAYASAGEQHYGVTFKKNERN